MAEVSEARAVPQPLRPSGAVWGVRGGSGGDADKNAFVSQAPSHKEKNKKKKTGRRGTHLWRCAGLAVSRAAGGSAPSGGAGLPRSLCWRSLLHRSGASPAELPRIGHSPAPAPLAPAGLGGKARTDSSAWRFLRHRLCFLHAGTRGSQEYRASTETQFLQSVSHGAPLTWGQGTCV